MNREEVRNIIHEYFTTMIHYPNPSDAASGGLSVGEVYVQVPNVESRESFSAPLYRIVSEMTESLGIPFVKQEVINVITEYIASLPMYQDVNFAVANGLTVGDFYIDTGLLESGDAAASIKKILQVSGDLGGG